ncbi:unnamed protein product [Prunus armeniaca]
MRQPEWGRGSGQRGWDKWPENGGVGEDLAGTCSGGRGCLRERERERERELRGGEDSCSRGGCV